MTTEWNKRTYQLNSNVEQNLESCSEHNERMKGFRKSHANVALVNGMRHAKPSLFESTQPLAVRRTTVESGGLRLSGDSIDWLAFVPMFPVNADNFSPN